MILNSNEIFYTAFEPVQKHRFAMYIDGIPAFMIKKVDGIKVENGEVVINHINVQRKVKGKSKWGDLSLSLHDAITPSGAQAVMEWERLHHESVTGRDGYSDFYKKDISIVVLGPVGDVVREWIAKGAFIKDGSFGGFDYDTDGEANAIELTLAVDYMILNY